MAKLLWTLREQYDLAFNVWAQFKEKAAVDGYTPNGALARLIRRYLERGFDDGRPERLDRTNRPDA